MAPSGKRPGNDALEAEISLQDLRKCLVNLPAPLVNVLVESDVVGDFRGILVPKKI